MFSLRLKHSRLTDIKTLQSITVTLPDCSRALSLFLSLSTCLIYWNWAISLGFYWILRICYLLACSRQSFTADTILPEVKEAPATESTSSEFDSTILAGIVSWASAVNDDSCCSTISTAEIFPSAIVVLTVIGPSCPSTVALYGKILYLCIIRKLIMI